MVCRENKGRSVAIRLAKIFAVQSGFPPVHDRELQSAIHEHLHDFKGAPEMTVAEQIQLWKSFKQQVESDNSLSWADKYRESHDQPGVVVRIDEEMQRLRTGLVRKRNGEEVPLKPENLNTGAQLQAIQYLGTRVPQIQRAKRRYFAVYARHTGGTIEQAERIWNQKMDARGDGRGNVGISLTDDYRDKLAVAGITAEDQSAIGQSARAREALAEMEQERLAVLASAPQRATIRPEHRRHFTASTGPQLKCTLCGQFGHEHSQCTNIDLVDRENELRNRYFGADSMRKAAEINQILTSGEVSDDTERQQLEADRDRWAGNREIPTLKSADKTLQEIADEQVKIDAEKQQRAPRKSSWVQQVAYSEESGLMEVTRQPWVDAKGNTHPATTSRYRVDKPTADYILGHPSIGKALNETVQKQGRGQSNDQFHWENRADEQAATVQHKCPTCGQWASMTSSHQCPVKGSGEASADIHARAAKAQWRRAARDARDAGLDEPDEPTARVQLSGGQYYGLPEGGRAFVPKPQDIIAVTDRGDIASAVVLASYTDGEVSGQATVWQDPAGLRLVSPRREAGGNGLRCDCADYKKDGRCRHIRAATEAVAKNWGAVAALNAAYQPGISVAEVRRNLNSDTAFDAPRAREMSERMDYATIRKHRAAKFGNHKAGLFEKRRSGTPINGPVRPPTDSEGNPTDWPTRFDLPDRVDENGNRVERFVDLNNIEQVQYQLRAGFFSQNRMHVSAVQEPDGGLRLTVPKKRRARNGSIPEHERAAFCAALGLPRTSYRSDGVYIAPDTSARHEFINRVYGRTPTIRAARYSVA